MKALVYEGGLNIQEKPKPTPEDNEALIRIRMAGICNTDIEITKGYMDFRGVLGHEFVGDVIDCPQNDWLGKRIVGEINLGCRSCDYCRSGLERHCPQRKVLGILNKDGAFAEYVTLPITNLVAVPNSITDDEAVFVEPLAAACEIIEQVHIEPTHSVAIVGDGKLGQLIARVLRLIGCELTVYGMSQQKLKLLESLGVETRMSESAGNDKYDFVVEASGSPSGFNTALDLVKPRGTFILKSTTHENPVVQLSRLVIDEIRLIGSRCGRFEPAIRLFEKGLIDISTLITKVYPFEDALAAFEEATAPLSLKILLNFLR